MATPKTQRTTASVSEFLAAVGDPARRADAQAVCELMTAATGVQPAMWGSAIVGFGSYSYHHGSGTRAEWPAVGLSPRKQSLTVYLADGFDGRGGLLERLGPHSLGRGCLYLRRLSDVDMGVLTELVRESFGNVNGRTVEPGQGWS